MPRQQICAQPQAASSLKIPMTRTTLHNDFPYPVARLSEEINNRLRDIKGVEIHDAIAQGRLEPHIVVTDQDGPICHVASICPNPLTNKYQVNISAALLQFLWHMSHIALLLADSSIVAEKFAKQGLRGEHLLQALAHSQPSQRPLSEEERRQVDYVKQMADWDEVCRCTYEEFQLAATLLPESEAPIDKALFHTIDLTSPTGQMTNGICIYGAIYILLHEFAHMALGHSMISEERQEEKEADFSALGDLLTIVDKEEQHSAYLGILAALVTLMFLDPTLEGDASHPAPHLRLFAMYDQVEVAYPKSAYLLAHFLRLWAFHNDRQDVFAAMEQATDASDAVRRVRTLLCSASL